MNSITYTVPKIHCHNCVNTIKMEVGELEGVRSVEGNVEGKMVFVEYTEPATLEQIVNRMVEINYTPTST